MERIAPLAKILAEANGIEWQKLQGTGDGGMIVEQDILNYLSRVMSGEEDPPETPVDPTPPDWTGEDLPAGGMFDASALSKAGIDSDIAEFVEQSRGAPAPVAAANVAANDDFELEDEVELAPTPSQQVPSQPAATPVPPAPQAPAASSTAPFGMPDLSSPPANAPAVSAMPTGLGATAPTPEPAAPTFFTPPVPSSTPSPSAPPSGMPSAAAPSSFPTGSADAAQQPQQAQPESAAPAPSGGLGSLLSRLYQGRGKEPAPAGSEPAASEPAAPTPPPAQPSSAQSSPAQSSAAPAAPEPTPAPAPTPVTPEPAPAPPVMPSMPDPVAPAPEPTPVVSEPVSEPPAHVAQQTVTQQEEQAAAVAPEPAPTPVAQPAPALSQPVQPASSQPATSAPAMAQPQGEGVWFGTYMRRNVASSQLQDLLPQLSEALEREVSAALLVARAAQRYAADLGLASVALRDPKAGQTHALSHQSTGLREMVAHLGEAADGQPDLLIVDAAALDMDDLHYPETLTLSVGRSTDGTFALSLNGNVAPEEAAAFLARVASSLEKPVALIL